VQNKISSCSLVQPSTATDHCRALQRQLWAPACLLFCCAAPAGDAGADGAAAAVAAVGGGGAPQLWLVFERSTGHPPYTPAASAT
jgi:hypothetical protein